MKETNIISVFDTSISAYNAGNQIIMDAVMLELEEIFNNSFILRLPVEDIKKNTRRYNEISNISFLGGTNILNSDILNYRQMDLSLHNILILSEIVLLGCGWFQYEQRPITKYTKWAYKNIFSKKYIHSVRDNYTKEKMESIGLKVINTGCPTLWRLDNNVISKQKKDGVVITLTDYNKEPERDKLILETCIRNYRTVYYYPQGMGDLNYLENLGYNSKLKIISPQLKFFNDLLSSGKVDYIGTRLHAGIRALQKGVRTIIIGIDNRAVEMAKDFDLPVLDQIKINELNQLVNNPININVNVPIENINIWKSQFIIK